MILHKLKFKNLPDGVSRTRFRVDLLTSVDNVASTFETFFTFLRAEPFRLDFGALLSITLFRTADSMFTLTDASCKKIPGYGQGRG